MWRRFIGQQVLARTPSQEHISLERGDHRPYVPHGQGAMSGTNEALWFAPGSDYMLGDDDWDPYQPGSDEEEETLDSAANKLRDMADNISEVDDDQDEQLEPMGQGYDAPSRSIAQPAAERQEPERIVEDSGRTLAEINRDIEIKINKIQKEQGDFRTKKRNLEDELKELMKEEDSMEPREFLQKKEKLIEDIKAADADIMKTSAMIDDLLAEARNEARKAKEAKKNEKYAVQRRCDIIPRPEPPRPINDGASRRAGIPRPEPQGKSDGASRRAAIPRPPGQSGKKEKISSVQRDLCPDDFAMFGFLRRTLPGQKEQQQKLETELEAVNQEMVAATKRADLRSSPPGPQPRNMTGTIVQDNGSTPSQRRSLSLADVVIEADPKEIEAKRSKLEWVYQPLVADTAAKEVQLDAITKMIEAHPKVRRARRRYKKERLKFIDSIFRSILHGKLDDVAILTAALDLEGRAHLITIENIIQPQSHLSVIHLALLKDRKDIVKFLLKHSGRELATVSAETEECENMTPLYIAMQHGSFDNIQLLVESVPKEDNERAEYINTIVPNSTYAGMPYDELPLAGTTWSSIGKDQKEVSKILDYLVENGADLGLQTSEGNTLLHLLVLQTVQSIVPYSSQETDANIAYFRGFLKDAFSKAVGRWWLEKRKWLGKRKLSTKEAEIRGLKHLMKVENGEKLTPLALAAKVESPLYMDLINWENVIRYPDLKMSKQFSNVDTYDITNVTSLKSTPKGYVYNPNSVMHVLAHNDVDLSAKGWNVDIANIEPLQTIIKQKWRVYMKVFYLWGLIHIVHMLAFTMITFTYEKQNAKMEKKSPLVAATNSTKGNDTGPDSQELASGYYGPVSPGNPYFAFFLVLPVGYIISECVDLFAKGKKFVARYSLTGNFIYRLLCVTFSVFTIVWFILHMAKNVNQDIILSIALLLGWHFGIFFTRTIHFPSKTSQIGAFSIMVQRMLFHDLIPFLLISAFVLVAFSAAIHATFIHSKQAVEEGITFRITLFNMLKYYSALDDGQSHESSREQEFAKAVLSIYGIISVVLLVNMLIAAMNKTYDMVRETHTDLVVRQRLSILLLLERRLSFKWLQDKAQSEFDSRENVRTKEYETFLKLVSDREVAKLAQEKRKSKKKE